MNSTLIVIDAQKIYTDAESEMFCEDADGTIERINKLIRTFQENSRPIVYVRHVHKKDGSDLGRLFDFAGEPEEEFSFVEGTEEVEYDDRLTVIKDAPEIIKRRYSAFNGTNLDDTLKSLSTDKIAVCGFMTNFCCESTAREALDRDYYVDFIVDATGTPGTDNYDESKIREVVGELLEAGFSRVFNAKEYVENEL